MAEAIEGRMTAERLSPTAFETKSGLSSPMCLEVRAGTRKRYAYRTRIGVAKALRWPVDWYDRLVAGEDWTTFPDTDHPDVPSTETRLTALEEQMAEIRAVVTRLADEARRPGP